MMQTLRNTHLTNPVTNHPTNAPAVRLLTVDADTAGQRLDNFLIAQLKGVPKTHIYKLIRKAEVRVNKKRPSADQRLAAGDQVRIPPVRVAERAPKPTPSEQLKQTLDQAILYEDDHLLVMNKPAGMAVHGGSGVSLGMIEAVRQWRPYASKWELVHRLDRDTSGCLVIAKKPSVQKAMQANWENFQKRYYALVAGQWSRKTQWVNAPLLKNILQSGERMVKVAQSGKPALSEFAIMQAWQSATLVQVTLHTGRTHQIRVHAQYQQHALLGDDKYGNQQSQQLSQQLGVKRIQFHAFELTFQHPITGQTHHIQADMPEDMNATLARLSAQAGR
jgi:23S rRNA pseudouridine955/2504/2580 synthase